MPTAPYTQGDIDESLPSLNDLPWLKLYAINTSEPDSGSFDQSMPYLSQSGSVVTVEYTATTANGRTALGNTIATDAMANGLSVSATRDAIVVGLASGTYTPTITGVTNVAASTAYQAQYLRVGNTVTVSGKTDIDATSSSSATRFGLSLPIASNFGAEEDLGGIMAIYLASVTPGIIYADTTNDRADFYYFAPSAVNLPLRWHFTYQVI